MTLAGLRPGEKLYEEKLMAEEGMKKTDNDLIHIGKPIPFDISKFLRQLTELAQASYENDLSGDMDVIPQEFLADPVKRKPVYVLGIHDACRK